MSMARAGERDSSVPPLPVSHLALYRKYRSQTFGDLIGQDHVVRTLQNGIVQGRVAHAYLFTGPRGTGKTSSARLLAKALCCAEGPTAEPCNACEICRSITEGSCVDVLEMDAASESGVDDIRQSIVEVAEYQPMMCRYKVFIIDEVHDLSAKAFDALLKTIEEPPAHVVFILATTEYNKVPPTIRSRCQKYEFHRATLQDLVRRLEQVAAAEGVEAEPAALSALARMADGGYRDALTLLEQAMITAEGPVTLQHVYDQLGLIGEETVDALLVALREVDVAGAIELLAETARLGRDPRAVLESMLYRISDLTRVSYGLDVGPTLDSARDSAMHEIAARLGRDTLLKLRSAIAEVHRSIREISLPRLWLESELIRISTEVLSAPAAPKVARPADGKRVETKAAHPGPADQRPADRNPTEQRPATVQPAETAAARQAASGQAAAREPSPQVASREPSTREPSTQDAPQEAASQGAAVAQSPAEVSPEVELWQRVVDDLARVSKTMAMRLAGTRATRLADGRLSVEFERQMDLEWVKDVPKRYGAIREKVRELSGEGLELDLQVGKLGAKLEEPQAVELAAEGQRLNEMAREIFN
jgi:DNA polymerase III subunit gamma/tau